MIKFRQKEYTLSEGHYTGPKDMEDVPGALKVIGGTTLAGTAIGGLVGGIMKDSSVSAGADVGLKSGFLTGVAAKLLLNTLHNPMSKVKFSEVDKNIRARFGIVRLSGITVGDTRGKRETFREKFVVNDRDILSHKINVAIQDNKVIMYTLGLTPEEIKKLDNILDYHCKKYTGMNYISTVIGRTGSQCTNYAVDIVFTNYQVIASFFIEVSDELGVQINLLDSKAIVENKLESSKEEDGEEEREFSLTKRIGKGDLLKGLSTGVLFGRITPGSIIFSLMDILPKASSAERYKILGSVARKDMGNRFLEKAMEDQGYLPAVHYTVSSDNNNNLCMMMDSGVLLVGVKKTSKEATIFKKIAKDWDKPRDFGTVLLYRYLTKSVGELKILLGNIITAGIKPNIYDKI